MTRLQCRQLLQQIVHCPHLWSFATKDKWFSYKKQGIRNLGKVGIIRLTFCDSNSGYQRSIDSLSRNYSSPLPYPVQMDLQSATSNSNVKCLCYAFSNSSSSLYNIVIFQNYIPLCTSWIRNFIATAKICFKTKFNFMVFCNVFKTENGFCVSFLLTWIATSNMRLPTLLNVWLSVNIISAKWSWTLYVPFCKQRP